MVEENAEHCLPEESTSTEGLSNDNIAPSSKPIDAHPKPTDITRTETKSKTKKKLVSPEYKTKIWHLNEPHGGEIRIVRDHVGLPPIISVDKFINTPEVKTVLPPAKLFQLPQATVHNVAAKEYHVPILELLIS